MTNTIQISNTGPQNFEEILDNLGGFGRFQILILILLLFFEIPSAYIVFIQIFAGIPPKFWNCDGEVVDKVGACGCNGTLEAPSTSIVAEWHLICESAWIPDFITSIQMAGMLFGNLYATQTSDWYGRKYSTFSTILVCALGSAVAAVAPNPYIYAVARFFCGAGFSGYLSISAIYTIEFMPTKWRMLCGAVGPFGEATMSLALIAYYIPTWRYLTWATMTPLLLTPLIFPFVPESPRWLLQKGKTDDLVKVLTYIAKINKCPPIELETIEKIVAKANPTRKPTDVKEPRLNFFDFAKSKNKEIRMKAICLMAIFFAFSIIYFGLSFNIKNMNGNLYWNLVFLGFVDSVGFKMAIFVMGRLSRRLAVFLSMTIGVFFLVVLAIFQLTLDVSEFSTLFLVAALLGKFSSAITRSAARALAGESFPTSVRAMGSGLCGASTAFGGVVGAQLAYFGTKNPSIPFFAFAIIGIFGSLFSFLMTETKGQALQETVGRKRSRTLSVISTISNLVLPNNSKQETSNTQL